MGGFGYTDLMPSIELFFSLKRFAHRALWKNGAPPWAPLSLLEHYTKSATHSIMITIPSGVFLERPELISIGPGTIIEPGVFIQGPCIIGAQCIIRHGAYLRGPLIIGDRCVVGHSAELKNSILLDSCNATHFVYVGDSIIGNRVNLAAGVKCANVRLDRKKIAVQFEEQQIQTGLLKFGSIVGDRTQIGCNAVLNPGTLIGRESLCYPLMNVRGYLPPETHAKGPSRSELINEGILRL